MSFFDHLLRGVLVAKEYTAKVYGGDGVEVLSCSWKK